jgi:hypothetical protein
VISVGREDGAPASNFAPHEIRVHLLAQRHELHLRGDFALPRVVHLGYGAGAFQDHMAQFRWHLGVAVAAVLGECGQLVAAHLGDVAAGADPSLA